MLPAARIFIYRRRDYRIHSFQVVPHVETLAVRHRGDRHCPETVRIGNEIEGLHLQFAKVIPQMAAHAGTNDFTRPARIECKRDAAGGPRLPYRSSSGLGLS